MSVSRDPDRQARPGPPHSISPAKEDPFRSEIIARRKLELAWHARDYDQIANLASALCLARVSIRERAFAASQTYAINRLDQLSTGASEGCTLLEPPLIGAEGRSYRDSAWARRIPCIIVTREPRTRSGLWPVVAVGGGSYRAQVEPPEGVRPAPDTLRGDELNAPPSIEWFTLACRAIGMAILKKVEALEHPAWRVEDLIDGALAHPDDERVLEALIVNANEARCIPAPTHGRPDSTDPYCF